MIDFLRETGKILTFLEVGFAVMDRKVAELNIEHFRQKLAQESDPTRRTRLQELLDEEERKLKTILAREKEDRSRIS